MTLAVVAVTLIGGFIAYVNGANDVSKGIATLAGSGVTDYRRANHAAAFGLPMSTTHVSSGAIIAAGFQQNGHMNRYTVRDMLLAWIFTLPAAASLGVAAYELLRATHFG